MNAGDLLEIRIPRTVFGIGALARLADVAKDLGARNALIITDAGHPVAFPPAVKEKVILV